VVQVLQGGIPLDFDKKEEKKQRTIVEFNWQGDMKYGIERLG